MFLHSLYNHLEATRTQLHICLSALLCMFAQGAHARTTEKAYSAIACENADVMLHAAVKF